MDEAQSTMERRSKRDGSRPGSGSGRNDLWADETLEALGLAVEGLVVEAGGRGSSAGRQFRVDLVVGPGLADVRHRSWWRAGTRWPSLYEAAAMASSIRGTDPAGGESVVVDAAGIARSRTGRRLDSSGR